MGLAFPKPEPRRRIKARADRAKTEARRDCRIAVFARARSRCENCGKPVVPHTSPLATPWNLGVCHEPGRRSLGADATDPSQVVLLCQPCHLKAHGRL